jgi:4-amino-4-deoxy-L-arabinose transferase-like glycosyltransferase
MTADSPPARVGEAAAVPAPAREGTLFSRVWSASHIRWLVAIFVLALVLRVLWLGLVTPEPDDGRYDDTVWYAYSGRFLLDGRGYVNPWQGTPTAKWPVGYTLLLAGVYWFPGDDFIAAKVLNAVVGSLTVVGVYLIAQRIVNRRAGLVAAALMALLPSHIFFSTLIMTEVVFTGLVVAVLWFVMAGTLGGEYRYRWLRLLALGVLIGAAAMVRGEGALLLLLPLAGWALAFRSWRKVGLYLVPTVAGMALLFVPWTVRNAIELGEPVVGTTGVGGVLIQGHHKDADGRPKLFLLSNFQSQFADVPLPEQEVRINNEGVREAIDYAVHHIRHELRLIPRRFFYFYEEDRGAIDWVQSPKSEDHDGLMPRWHGEGHRELTAVWDRAWGSLADGYYYGILALAVLGLPLWFSRRRVDHLLLLVLIGYYTVLWSVVFVGESRYHMPVLPVLVIWAAASLTALEARWRRGTA